MTDKSIKYEEEREKLEPKHQRQLKKLKGMMYFPRSKFGFMKGNKQYLYDMFGENRWGNDEVGIVGKYTERIMICARWLGKNQVYDIPAMSQLALKLEEYIEKQNRSQGSNEGMLSMSIMTPETLANQMYLKTDNWEDNPLAKWMGLKSEKEFKEGFYLWVTKYV